MMKDYLNSALILIISHVSVLAGAGQSDRSGDAQVGPDGGDIYIEAEASNM